MNRRRLTIMRMLNTRKKYTARELAEHLEVSIRTIQRDLAALQEMGVPVYTEAGVHGGYRVLQNGILPPLQLRLQEAYGIYLMMEFLEKVQDLPYGGVREALAEYYAHDLPYEVQERMDRIKEHIMFSQSAPVRSAPFTTEVLDAAVEKRKLSFHYDGRNGLKRGEAFPLGIYYEKGHWYMPGQQDSGNILLYRVDRMSEVKIEEECNETIPSLKQWLSKREQPAGHPAVILFTDFGQRLAESDPMFQEREEEGTVWRGEIPESELAYTARHLLSYGPEVRVIEPESLKEQIRMLHKKSLEQYEE
ncbi:YafY family transcriptional regulator [Neobacillus mesonae]|nr:YafY family transcriptional regulator [Neobacillus mesonae]